MAILTLRLIAMGALLRGRALTRSTVSYRKCISVLGIEDYGHTITTTNRLASLVAVQNCQKLQHRLYSCQLHCFRIGVMAGICKRFPPLVFQVSHTLQYGMGFIL